MKIAHYLKAIDLEEGGVVRAVLDMCSVLAELDHEVTLITCNDKDVPAEWRGGSRVPRITVIEPPTLPGGRFSAPVRRQVEQILKTVDVLHLHAVWRPDNAQFATLARKLALPYVNSIHGMLDDWSMSQRGLKKRIYLALTGRKVLEGAQFVHCTAQAELEQARKWFPQGEGIVVPLIFDLALFQDLPGPELARQKWGLDPDGPPRLLFLSRLHYKKGVEHLIQAADLLRKRGVACETLIAGTGDEAYTQKLRRLTDQLGLTKQVRFLGFASGTEKVSLFEAADLFVLPTSQENFAFVVFESLAAKTPLVTTRGVDTWPELTESGGGTIVDAKPEILADTIANLLSDREVLQDMGAKGRAWVLEHLEQKTVAKQFESLYRAAIDK